MKFKDEIFKGALFIIIIMTGYLVRGMDNKMDIMSNKVDKMSSTVPVIEIKLDTFTNALFDTAEMSQDNREQILILKASQPQKKGLVTIKNSESLLNYTDPINMVYIGNKRVDKLVQQDIIKHY